MLSLAAGWAVGAAAQAQVAAGLSLTTDYRLRGVSLSDRRGALAASLSDDLANGVYFGGSAVIEDAPGSHLRVLGDFEYLGYARRLANGASWEVGVDNQHYSGYGPQSFDLHYSDIYAGVSVRNFGARLSYSPNYNGLDHNVLYAEANAVMRPADGWRVAGHVGVFTPLNHWRGISPRPRYDGRVDVIRSFGRTELSLGWAGVTPGFAFDPKRTNGGLIVGASVYF